MLTEEQFVTFKADIAEHGLHEPIWIYEGKILDGRNRYRACCELDMTPLFRDYTGSSPAAFVWSQNGERRQLTHGQKAAIAVEMMPTLEEESRVRQFAGLRRGTMPGITPARNRPRSERTDTAAHAASIVGVSATSVSEARAVKNKDPQTFEQIKLGVLKVGPAYHELRAKGIVGAQVGRAQPLALRIEAIRRLAKDGNRSQQIAEEIGISPEHVRELARKGSVVLPDQALGHATRIDMRRVIEQSVGTLEGIALGLKTVNGARVECAPHEAQEWVKSIAASMRIIGQLKKTLRGIST